MSSEQSIMDTTEQPAGESRAKLPDQTSKAAQGQSQTTVVQPQGAAQGQGGQTSAGHQSQRAQTQDQPVLRAPVQQIQGLSVGSQMSESRGLHTHTLPPLSALLPPERPPRRVEDSEISYKEELPRGQETDFSERERDWDSNDRNRRFEREYKEDRRDAYRERDGYYGRDRYPRMDDRDRDYAPRAGGYREPPRFRRSRSRDRDRRYSDPLERPVFPTLGPQLFIAKVPPYATVEEITSIFREYGQIREITPKRGFCFVEYERVEDAEKAYFGAQGRNLLNHSLIIQVAGARARNRQSEQCWSCSDYGHISRDCPAKRRELRSPETVARDGERRREGYGGGNRGEDDYFRGRDEGDRFRERDRVRDYYRGERDERPSYRERDRDRERDREEISGRRSTSPRLREYAESRVGGGRGYSGSRSPERGVVGRRFEEDQSVVRGKKRSILSDDYYENEGSEWGPKGDEKVSRAHDESTSVSVQRHEGPLGGTHSEGY